MEGKLIKTEHGWYVSYRWESDLSATDGGFIPLDPSDVLSADLNFPDSLNKPVFFDMTEPFNDGIVYAKIHAYIDEDVIEMSESFGVDVKCPPDCPHCAYEHQQLYEEELEKEAAIDFAKWLAQSWMAIWVVDKWLWENVEEDKPKEYNGYKTEEELYELYLKSM